MHWERRASTRIWDPDRELTGRSSRAERRTGSLDNVDIGLTRPDVAYPKGGLALFDHSSSKAPACTRRQAIHEGQLVDVTDVAHVDLLRAPRIPVALTDTVWRRLQSTGDRAQKRADRERVLRILQGARTAVVNHLHVLGRTPFAVRLGRRTTPLVIEFHESDEGEVVATIMLDEKRARR